MQYFQHTDWLRAGHFQKVQKIESEYKKLKLRAESCMRVIQ